MRYLDVESTLRPAILDPVTRSSDFTDVIAGFRAGLDFEDGDGVAAVGLDLSMAGLTVGYTFDL